MSETVHVLPDLQALPATGPLFFKAALSVSRKPLESPQILRTQVRLRGLKFDENHLGSYNRLCGLPAHEVSINYPQVLAAPLHMHLMTQTEFPLPLMGIVHLRNSTVLHRPWLAGAEYDVNVRIGDVVRSYHGIELDLVTEYYESGECVWSAVTTVLYRQKPLPGTPRPNQAKAGPTSAQYLYFDAPEDIGRRYAPIAQDYNPIHMHAFSAKLFGFPRAIAHGMWSVARCLGALQPQLSGPVTRLDVQFKKPVLLPSKVTIKHFEQEQSLGFDLLAREGGNTHLSGRIYTG